MLEEWVEENIMGVLIAIEVMWVAGFLGVFVVYFLVKRHFAKLKAAQSADEKTEPPPRQQGGS